MTPFQAMVVEELDEMKTVGMYVPDGAVTMAKDETRMSLYENMGISECAELVIEMANIEKTRADMTRLPDEVLAPRYDPKRPYYVVRRTDEDQVWFELRGPLSQPAPLDGIEDIDGFVEWVNDIYQLGFEAGYSKTIDFVASRELDEPPFERST